MLAMQFLCYANHFSLFHFLFILVWFSIFFLFFKLQLTAILRMCCVYYCSLKHVKKWLRKMDLSFYSLDSFNLATNVPFVLANKEISHWILNVRSEKNKNKRNNNYSRLFSFVWCWFFDSLSFTPSLHFVVRTFLFEW